MKTNIFYHFKKATSIDEQTKERKYKYYQDYIDTLSEEDILEFLKDCGNPHREEKDISLRMFWELSDINNATMHDAYFKYYNHD